MRQSRITAICLWAAACLWVAGKAETPANPASENPPALSQNSGRAAAVVEMQSDWIAQYEANGPEGAAAVPMQKCSWLQLALAVGVLLGCGFLAARAGKSAAADNAGPETAL